MSQPEEILKTLETLREAKSMLTERYDDLVKYFMLNYRKDEIDVPTIGYWCSEQLAAYLHTGLTNPSTKWISLLPPEQDIGRDDNVMKHLQKVENTIYDAFGSPETRFNAAMRKCYLELIIFGTAVIYIQRSDDSPFGMHYVSIAIKECFIREDSAGGVDTLFREFTMSVRNVKARFDYTDQDKEDTDEIDIIHAVEPKDGKYLSTYMTKDEKILEQEELDSFPYLVPRWSVGADIIYGRSPAMMGMNSIIGIEQDKKLLKRQERLAVDPTVWVASVDSQTPFTREPSGINVYRHKDEIPFVMQPSSNIQVGKLTLRENIEDLKRIFFLDQIPLENKPNMTATEVSIRERQHTRTMSPITSGIESELLRPLIIKTYKILEEEKLIPEFPSGYKIETLKFEYISTLAKGQKIEEVMSFRNAVEDIRSITQLPQIACMDKISLDKCITEIIYMHGAPLSILRSDEEAEAVRQERQKIMEQQQQAQQAQQEQVGMENA